jgi:hypothetical protein
LVQPIIQANSEHILREMELADYGEHNLLIYPNLTTLTKVYSQYIKSRLHAKMELILFLSSYQSVNQVRSILRHNGLDLARHEGNGSLVILDTAKGYVVQNLISCFFSGYYPKEHKIKEGLVAQYLQIWVCLVCLANKNIS